MSKVLLCYEDYSEMMTIQSVLKKVGFDVLTISSEFSLSQQILSFNPDIVVGYGRGPKVATVGVGRRMKEMPRWLGRVVLIFPAGAKPDPADLARIRMDMALEAPLEVTRLIQVLANLTNQDPRLLVERMMKAVAQESQDQQRIAGGKADKPDEPVFVTGAREKTESWNVNGNAAIDEFNRMMGLTSPATEAKSIPASTEKLPQFSLSQSVEGEAALAETALLGAHVQQEIADANAKLSGKMQSYAKFLNESVPPAKASLKRTETRKAQKDLRKDWKDEDLRSQDELRRQFTQALFKKKD